MKGSVGVIIVLILIVMGFVALKYFKGTVWNRGSDVVVLTVGPEEVDCVGSRPQKCLVVDGSNFYSHIEGFVFEPGYEYVLKVKRRKVDNPPADASSIKYKLIRVVSRSVAVPQDRSE